MAQQNRDSLARQAQLLAEDTSIDDLQEFARYLMNKRTLGTYMALVRALPEDFIEFRGNNNRRPNSGGSTSSRNINSDLQGSNDGFSTPVSASQMQASSTLQSPAEIASAQQLRDYNAAQSQSSSSSSQQPAQQPSQRQTPSRANKIWTKNDLTTLKIELASGKSFAQVASSLGRTAFAVKCKLKEQVNALGHLNNAEIARAMHMSIRQVEEVKYMRLRRN